MCDVNCSSLMRLFLSMVETYNYFLKKLMMINIDSVKVSQNM